MNKLLRFRSWSIMAKLSGLTTLSFLPLFIVLVLYIMPAFEEKFLDDKKQLIKSAVESTYNILDYYDQKVASGVMTIEEAQKTAGDEITALRYSGKEYFFMYDLDGNTKALGSDPKKIGTNRLDLKDAKNVYFVKEMVKICREKGEGYVTYYYPKLGDTVAYPKISFVKYHSKWGFFIGSGVYFDDVDKAISEFRIKIIIPTLVVLLIAIGFGYLVSKKVSTPIKQLDSAAKEVAKGNTAVSVKLDLEDEIGDLAHNFNLMTRSIAESMESVNAEKRLAEAALNEAEVAKRNAQEQEKYLAEHVELMLHEMERFAEGDLTIHLSESDSGTMGQLFKGFNRSVRNIRSMMLKVTEVVQSTTMASAQISSSTEELASGAQEQTMQTHQVASAIEEMTTTIIQTTRNASEAADNARIAKQIALDGGKVVNETIDGIIKIATVVSRASETVSQLGDNSDKIGAIIQVIDDIADQTNLLALNAAIEAARAGEQGRGFAVVADEVRKLAERTTKATKEIAVMIKNIQSDTHLAVSSIVEGSKEVEKGKALANKAGGALKEIITAAQKVMDEVSQVATASEEQSSTAADIGQSVNGINAITQQSSIGTQQIAEVATGLHALTNRLKEQIQEFRL